MSELLGSENKKQKCQNCQKEIEQQKYDLHFSYCRRNCRKCNICQKIYDINYLQEHELQQHIKRRCKYCHIQIAQKQIETHQIKCKPKLFKCIYCDLQVPQLMFQSHLAMCQSRTVSCQICQKSVANKFLKNHEVQCFERLCADNDNIKNANQKSKTLQKSIDSQFQNGTKKPKILNSLTQKCSKKSVAKQLFQNKYKKIKVGSQVNSKQNTKTKSKINEVINIEDEVQEVKQTNIKQKAQTAKQSWKKDSQQCYDQKQ